jgi:flagellar basal-body rod protein FlgB
MLGIEPVFADLSRALELAAMRHAVYANNIANVSTVGYRRLEVLATATAPGVDAADAAGMQEPVGRIVPSASSVVQLDHEMALVATNAVHYQMLIGTFERVSGLLRMAIHEGKDG